MVEHTGTPTKKARKPKSDKKREAFAPDQVEKLLRGFGDWGSRQGDLMRLALVTGCRVDEIGSLMMDDVESDGSGFTIRAGKTDNAARYIPLVGDAQRLLVGRTEKAAQLQAQLSSDQRRLFPEWSLKPSTGKVSGVSQWFTRYRRQTLGAETDGRMVFHSFRHTWRTVARRAGVAEDRIRDLGGWEGDKDTADGYDHGLLREQLEKAQQDIWKAMEQQGYLTAF
ncbi:MAG: tyrosine-type recombinase/integrase [Paracoccaceae bacterium]|nr:tyrosine-type recombinase/integrase [Paracoccaceae bacterium]